MNNGQGIAIICALLFAIGSLLYATSKVLAMPKPAPDCREIPGHEITKSLVEIQTGAVTCFYRKAAPPPKGKING